MATNLGLYFFRGKSEAGGGGGATKKAAADGQYHVACWSFHPHTKETNESPDKDSDRNNALEESDNDNSEKSNENPSADALGDFKYIILQDGPAPHFPLVTAWLEKHAAQHELEAVHVACQAGMNGSRRVKKGKNRASASTDDENNGDGLPRGLAVWMETMQTELEQQQKVLDSTSGPANQFEEGDPMNDATAAVAKSATTTTPVLLHTAHVPSNVHKDGTAILRQLVENNTSALYALQANLDLTTSTTTSQSSQASPLVCGLSVLLEALGLYRQHIPELAQGNRYYTLLPDVPTSGFLVLDRAAREALNVWPLQHQGQAATQLGTGPQATGALSPASCSLFGLVTQYAVTSMGQRLLAQWIRQPLVELEPLWQRQEAVTCAVHHTSLRQGLADHGLVSFSSIHLTLLAQQLEEYCSYVKERDQAGGNSATTPKPPVPTRKVLQALYQLFLVADQKLPALASHLAEVDVSECVGDTNMTLGGPSFHQRNRELFPPLWPQWAFQIQTSVEELQGAAQLGLAVLDLDAAPREFRVQSTFSEQLQEIDSELQENQASVQRALEDMNEAWCQASGSSGSGDALYVRLHTDESNGKYEFRLPKTNDSKIVQKMPGVQVHRILKNGVYFSNAEIRQLSTEKQDLQADYDRRSRTLVMDALVVAATYSPLLRRLGHTLANLDAIVSLAQLAAYSPGYVCPELTDLDPQVHPDAGICLQGARHPCVELQDNVDYIPNDVDMKYGEKSCWIVTGPNMAGKSTYIRATGAVVTLAQMGSYVPCTHARINLCHAILARVGAGDLQDRGISTFMSEMLEASAILQTANRRSLIIIDELGRGTSTFDGYGLARSIAEYLVEQTGCLTVFATHFHELTSALPARLGSRVHNCHVSAAHNDKNELTFLYQVCDGPCLQSFGIAVAQMANVPQAVLVEAKRKAAQLEEFAPAQTFVSKFRRLDLPQLWKETESNEDMRRTKLWKLLVPDTTAVS